MTRIPNCNNLNQYPSSYGARQEEMNPAPVNQLNANGGQQTEGANLTSISSNYSESYNQIYQSFHYGLPYYPSANPSTSSAMSCPPTHSYMPETRIQQSLSNFQKELDNVIEERKKLEKREKELRDNIASCNAELLTLRAKSSASRGMNGISTNAPASVYSQNGSSSAPVVNGSRNNMYLSMNSQFLQSRPTTMPTNQQVSPVLAPNVTASSQYCPRTQNSASAHSSSMSMSNADPRLHNRPPYYTSNSYDPSGYKNKATSNMSYVPTPLPQNNVTPFLNKANGLLLQSSVPPMASHSHTTYSTNENDKHYLTNRNRTETNDSSRVGASLCPSKGKQLGNMLQFKSLPLVYDCIEDELISPRVCSESVFSLAFTLSSEQCQVLRSTPLKRILLRCCHYKPRKTSQNDRISKKMIVKINGKPIAFGSKYNNFFKAPLDITEHCQRNSTLNDIELRWGDEASKFKEFGVGVFLVRRLNIDESLKVLNEERYLRNSSETIKIVQKKLANTSDICSESMKVPLTCPITKQVLHLPCVGSKCEHLSCFDASAFFHMTVKKTEWVCPLCKRQIGLNELKVDGLIVQILEETSRKYNQIEFERNGKWKPVTEEVKEQLPATMTTIEDSAIDIITIDDSDDEVPANRSTPNSDGARTDQTEEDTEENETESSESSAQGSDETDKIEKDKDDSDTDGSDMNISESSNNDEDYVPLGNTTAAPARQNSRSLRSRKTCSQSSHGTVLDSRPKKGPKRKRRRR